MCLQSGDHASGISFCLTQFHKLLQLKHITVYFMIKQKYVIDGLINVNEKQACDLNVMCSHLSKKSAH